MSERSDASGDGELILLPVGPAVGYSVEHGPRHVTCLSPPPLRQKIDARAAVWGVSKPTLPACARLRLSVCAKTILASPGVVVLIFASSWVQEFTASSRKHRIQQMPVGRWLGCKVEFFCLERGGFCGRDIRLPEVPAVVIDEAAVSSPLPPLPSSDLSRKDFKAHRQVSVIRPTDVCRVQTHAAAIPRRIVTVEVADGDGSFD